MCFVRKGLDKIFTQEELKWLDDIMPEVHKRAKEDELKRQDKEEVIQSQEDSVQSCLSQFVNFQEMVALRTADDHLINVKLSHLGTNLACKLYI